MEYGISLYPGLNSTLAHNLNLLTLAAKYGFKNLFLSFNIPEADYSSFVQEVSSVIQAAKQLNFNIISDVSPDSMKLVGLSSIDPSMAASLGITTLRLDFGFSPASIAALSCNKDNVKIQLNASTITPAILEQLKNAAADFTNITAMHNFYPREYTGLSEKFFTQQNRLLHRYGIKVFTFIAGEKNKRAPIFAGLPTLENHRYLSVSLASRHLAALAVDGIIIGDSYPEENELQILAQTKDNEISFSVTPLVDDNFTLNMLRQSFTARNDAAEFVIRAEEGRAQIKKCHQTIAPQNNIARTIGSVTLDNQEYLRYMGELQIIKHPLPADKRCNVIAQIPSEELFLISYLKPGGKFSFILP